MSCQRGTAKDELLQGAKNNNSGTVPRGSEGRWGKGSEQAVGQAQVVSAEARLWVLALGLMMQVES